MPVTTSTANVAMSSDLLAESNRTFKHRKTKVGDIYLYYVAGGQGDPVVLLHGWPQTWYMWRKVMLPLAQHHTVLAPDLRGSGDSDKPETGYDARTMAEDIRGLTGQRTFAAPGGVRGRWVGIAPSSKPGAKFGNLPTPSFRCRCWG